MLRVCASYTGVLCQLVLSPVPNELHLIQSVIFHLIVRYGDSWDT